MFKFQNPRCDNFYFMNRFLLNDEFLTNKEFMNDFFLANDNTIKDNISYLFESESDVLKSFNRT